MVSDTQVKTRDRLARIGYATGRALVGMSASAQYMSTGKMPAWTPAPPKKVSDIRRRLKYLTSDQTQPFATGNIPQKMSKLDKMAVKEQQEHPWTTMEQARRIATDHTRKGKK